jgi:RNA polymerase sigma-70 factor (ECF subfamily)
LNLPKPDIERVYGAYADALYRVARARLANDSDAQDAVQDVFLKYMTAAPAFRDQSHEQAWFLRALVNRCHDLARRRKVREALPLEEALGVAAPAESEAFHVMELLQKLPEQLKDAVILHYLEGFSVEETAGILQVSISAVKMRLSRAREQLRKEENDVQ